MGDTSTFIEKLREASPSLKCIFNEEELQPYCEDYRNLFKAPAIAACLPKSVEDIQKVVTLCNDYGVSIVPQGGNTSYCGAATPIENKEQVVLNLKRMNNRISLDSINHSILVEAGATLEQVQNFARDNNLLFPLDLGARSSTQIGGLISTNAGGINVIKFGNMRDLVLGLEFINAQGQIMNDLYRLRKNNTGYNLSHLLAGAEGTLGIITKAELKVVPYPQSEQTVLLAFNEFDEVIKSFEYLRKNCDEWLYSFEYLSRYSVDLTISAHVCRPINFNQEAQHFALVQLASCQQGIVEEKGIDTIAATIEIAKACDAIASQSQRQTDELWAFRESIPHAERHFGGSIKFDISVPISLMHQFLNSAINAVATSIEAHNLSIYGHVGDGNIHFNVLPPNDTPLSVFCRNHLANLEDIIGNLVHHYEGSFSAEHGIGQLKRHQLNTFKTEEHIRFLKSIKHALDPKGLFNPGKLLP